MLHYATDVQQAIGSGGAEASLTGTVRQGDGPVLARISCTTQAEEHADPAWCLSGYRSGSLQSDGVE